jgi:anaerobic selenocysteine-containing dehydrogenase
LLKRGGKRGEAPPLLVNPVDVSARGLENVKRVRVWNELGNVVLPLIISDAVPVGMVASEKGAWVATTGQTISALVSADAQGDLAKGACYNDTAVEVEA